MTTLIFEVQDPLSNEFSKKLSELSSLSKLTRIHKPSIPEPEWEWHLTFAGRYMQHSYYLYNVIDQVMIGNPNISGIVEIGTGYGALTEFLGLWGISRGIPVVTVDHAIIHDEHVLDSLGVHYLEMDEFSDEFLEYIKDFIESLDSLLFICDGGNKPKEFNLWAPLLKSGSIIAAHDWGTEINWSDIQSTIDTYCTPYAQEGWNKNGVRFAMFRIN